MPLHVSSRPLVADCLAGLRDATTPPDEFRVLSNKIINMLVYEATRELPTRRGTVRTPLREAETTLIDAEVVAIPVLRAGLGLLGPVLELLPRVSVGYIGLERDEETAVARIYYNKLPRLEGKVPLLLDPMPATGGSGARALDLIKDAGGRDPRQCFVGGAAKGVQAHPWRAPRGVTLLPAPGRFI